MYLDLCSSLDYRCKFSGLNVLPYYVKHFPPLEQRLDLKNSVMYVQASIHDTP